MCKILQVFELSSVPARNCETRAADRFRHILKRIPNVIALVIMQVLPRRTFVSINITETSTSQHGSPQIPLHVPLIDIVKI